MKKIKLLKPLMIAGIPCQIGAIVETDPSVAGELITNECAVLVVESAPVSEEASEETPAPAPRKGKK